MKIFNNMDKYEALKIICYIGSAVLSIAANMVGDRQKSSQFEEVTKAYCRDHFADLNFTNKDSI